MHYCNLEANVTQLHRYIFLTMHIYRVYIYVSCNVGWTAQNFTDIYLYRIYICVLCNNYIYYVIQQTIDIEQA